MIRTFQKLWRTRNRRAFATDAPDPEMFVEEVETPAQKETVKRSSVRILPVPRHPIFPKHPVRFRLSPEAFQALIADKTNSYIGAFVLKPREGKDELESAQALQ